MNPKIQQNLIALATAALRNEKVSGPPEAMAQLWAEVAEATKALAEFMASRPAPADGEPGNGG